MSDEASKTGNLIHDASSNNPPAAAPEKPKTLEEQVRADNAEFLAEVQEWLSSVSRAPETVTNDDTNEKFGKTVQKLVRLRGQAETRHKAVKEPHLTAGRTIDTIFLTGCKKPLEDAQKVLETRQKVFLRKKAADIAAAAAAEAEKKRREEDEARAASEAAQRHAETLQNEGDFDGAEVAMREAVAHEETAQAAQETAQVQEARADGPVADQVRTHSSLGVTISAKTEWVTALVDRTKIDWSALEPFFSDADILKAAKAAVKAGRRSIAGFSVTEDLKPINR